MTLKEFIKQFDKANSIVQFNNCIVDEDLWVKNRTYKMFKAWFEYTIHPMVYDLEVGFIEKI